MEEAGFHWEDVPVADHPFGIFLPILAPPGILSDRHPDDALKIVGIEPYVRDQSNGNGDIKIVEPFSPVLCGRFVAKIAHGCAVAVFGLDSFEPFLPEIIKGLSPRIARFVGNADKRGRRQRKLHSVTLEIRSGFLIANVQLFAIFGFRPYQVVVGRLSGDLLAYHRSISFRLDGVPE